MANSNFDPSANLDLSDPQVLQKLQGLAGIQRPQQISALLSPDATAPSSSADPGTLDLTDPSKGGSGWLTESDFANGKTPTVKSPDANVTASPYPRAPESNADAAVSPDASLPDFSGVGGKVPSVIANAAAGAITKPTLV